MGCCSLEKDVVWLLLCDPSSYCYDYTALAIMLLHSSWFNIEKEIANMPVAIKRIVRNIELLKPGSYIFRQI
jgi:hypothetical protein